MLPHRASQCAPDAPRTPAAAGQVTRHRAVRHGGVGRGQFRVPVVTVRSAEKAPQVPSGSIGRIRTRWVTPASVPT